MNNNTTSQYMDKQIMDLSNSHNPIPAHSGSGGNNDFIDFSNRPAEKKDDIVPSYDFMPIRPAVGSSSSPTAARSSNLDSVNEDVPIRTWNSVDSVIDAAPVRNYISHDANEPAKFVLGRNHKSSDVPLDASLVSEIDRTMKKHMDNVMHAVDKMSARLSQLETRARNIESSVGDLKIIVENNHGMTDGKMRSLENVLTEVLTGVKFIRDKQEISEAKLQIAKLQIPMPEQVETKNTVANPGPTQTAALPAPHQQFSNVPFLTQPPPPILQPHNPPVPAQQQKVQSQIQPANQFPQNQQEPYFPTSNQSPENPNQQQYQIPPSQHQYQPPPPQPQYSQPPPPPQPQFSQPPPPPSQPHPSFSSVNPSLPPPPPVGYNPEETPYVKSQTYPPNLRPPSGPPPPFPPSQQYYGPNPNTYEPPPGRIVTGPGYSGSFGQSSGHGGEPYHVKSQSGYPQLPTARLLQPTGSSVGGGPGSGSGSGNKVPIDDVVDRVTNMGFSRDQVRATVRRLTENGQAVDLNVVLDKLMNDGDGQVPRGWFGR